jgi:type I restriction enzyme, S subunit
VIKTDFFMKILMSMPSDWLKKTIRSICLKTDQWNPSKDKRDSFHYIDVSSVSNSTYSIKAASRVKVETAPGRARKIVKWQDTIFATIRPSLKRVAFITREYEDQIASTAFCVIRPNQKQAAPLYVYFFLLSDFLNSEIACLQHGASYPAVTDKDILNQTIFLPPLFEQKKIAAILFKIQQAIEIQECIIEKTQELKKSTLHHVFTHGLRGEKLKETEIGPIPESWEENILGEVADITYGAQAAVANAKNPSLGIPILTNINITNEGKIDLSTLRYYAVPNDKRDKLILQKGDILFNWRSGSQSHVGKTAYFDLDDKFTYSSFILRFRVFEAVNNFFLYYYFNYIKQCDFFSNRRNVSSINSVYNASLAATIPVYYPPTEDEQREIANILKTIDYKIDLYATKKTVLQDLFKTMLNKLMKGEIRVKDLDIDISEVNT